MMRLPATILLLLSLVGPETNAQAQGSPAPGARSLETASRPQAAAGVHGVVLGATGEPVNVASVAVWDATDSTFVSGAVTRPDGRFRIVGLQPGRYYVRVSALGFQQLVLPGIVLEEGGTLADLGEIRLAVSAVQIEGLSVIAEKRSVTMAPDRNTYTVKDTPAAAGGSAADLLRTIPAVEVDGQNQLSLRGDGNVVVQVDGRPTTLSGEELGRFLAQLPANMIERVEVMTNPSAKHDPDGMVGIINLALKQKTDLGLSTGISTGGGSTGQREASGNLAYQRGPLTVSTRYAYLHNQTATSGYDRRENRTLNPHTLLETDVLMTVSPESHTLNSGIEYNLSSRDALSGSFMVSKRDFDLELSALSRHLTANREPAGRTSWGTAGEIGELTVDYALAYRRTERPRINALVTELRLIRTGVSDERTYTGRAFGMDSSGDEVPARIERHKGDGISTHSTLQTDWTRVLRNGFKLETGLKGTLRFIDKHRLAERLSHGANTYMPEAPLGTSFDYRERVGAAYAVLSRNVRQFQFQSGLRVEQANTGFELTTTRDRFEDSYTDLFPSALVTVDPNDASQIKVSYSRRISRPVTQQLDPSAYYEDAQTIFRGNPHLQPEYAHAFEIGYQRSFERGTLQVVPYFRHSRSAVRVVRSVGENGVLTNSVQNVANTDSYGTDVNGNIRWGRLTGTIAINAFLQSTDGSNLGSDASNEGIGWSSRVNATWKLGPRLDLQGFLMYRAPMNVEQGRIRAASLANLSLQQKFMGERANLSLRLMDLFKTSGFGGEMSNHRFYRESRRNVGAQGIFLTFSYAVGEQPRMRQPVPPEGGVGGLVGP